MLRNSKQLCNSSILITFHSFIVSVAMTVHPSRSSDISSTILKFNDVKYSVGITNLSAYKTLENSHVNMTDCTWYQLLCCHILMMHDTSLTWMVILFHIHTSAIIAVNIILLVQLLLAESKIQMINMIKSDWKLRDRGIYIGDCFLNSQLLKSSEYIESIFEENAVNISWDESKEHVFFFYICFDVFEDLSFIIIWKKSAI